MNSRGPVAGAGRPRFGDDRLSLVVAARLSERPRDAAGVVIDAGTGWETLEAIADEPLLGPHPLRVSPAADCISVAYTA